MEDENMSVDGPVSEPIHGRPQQEPGSPVGELTQGEESSLQEPGSAPPQEASAGDSLEQEFLAKLQPLMEPLRQVATAQLMAGLDQSGVEFMQQEVLSQADPAVIMSNPQLARLLRLAALGASTERRREAIQVPGRERIVNGGYEPDSGISAKEIAAYDQVFGDLGSNVGQFLRKVN